MDILGVSRIDLHTQNLQLNPTQELQLEDALKRRAKGEPLQYIIGKTEFYGLSFYVAPGVFIPRPETEILVETVLNIFKGLPVDSCQSASVLDLCTGSGCIAISLAKYTKCDKIIATDVSEIAVNTAKKNAVLNGAGGKIDFRVASLFNGLRHNEKFDIITCNPPYIKKDDIKKLPQEVAWEPQIALDGGQDGLDFYRKISQGAAQFLKESGILALELGDGQAYEVKNMFGGNTKIIKDTNGIERVLIWIK